MGRFKTVESKRNADIRKAHRMAEAFAGARSKEFLKTFLEASGIPMWLGALTISLTKVTNDLIKKHEINLEVANQSGDKLGAERIQNEIADLKHLISDHAADDAGIMQDLMTDSEVDLHFGMAIALAYAMGYGDHMRGASIKQLHVPARLADDAAPDTSKQLILPGFDKDPA